MTAAAIVEHCEQADCTRPVATWCPLCEKYLCLLHDELVPIRRHDCLGGPADVAATTDVRAEQDQ